MTVSPFEHLQLPRNLVCEFFGVFSRLEFALKESNFSRANRHFRATPDWERFGEKIGELLVSKTDAAVRDAISYLLQEPPQVQVVENNSVQWKVVALRGRSAGERAIDAIQRVRNNLFHGGKHSPHSPVGRDEKLVRAALAVLEASVQLNKELLFNYENSKF